MPCPRHWIWGTSGPQKHHPRDWGTYGHPRHQGADVWSPPPGTFTSYEHSGEIRPRSKEGLRGGSRCKQRRQHLVSVCPRLPLLCVSSIPRWASLRWQDSSESSPTSPQLMSWGSKRHLETPRVCSGPPESSGPAPLLSPGDWGRDGTHRWPFPKDWTEREAGPPLHGIRTGTHAGHKNNKKQPTSASPLPSRC